MHQRIPLAPKAMPSVDFGTRIFKSWVDGPSGLWRICKKRSLWGQSQHGHPRVNTWSLQLIHLVGLLY